MITARGGSKRIPGKNIKQLGDKPLIVWTLDIIQKIPGISNVLVSTDDVGIKDICIENGALVPWLRPANLATDSTSSVDTALHALDWYETVHGRIDGLLLLQPTSPFRKIKTLLKGINLYFENNQRTVIGVSPTEKHPQHCFYIQDSTLKPFISGKKFEIRSQDLPPSYSLNGAFYLINPETLRNDLSFISENMLPLIIDDPVESLDIDTEWDWKIAELFARSNRNV